MNPNSKDFKKLQKQWYSKLKDDGFQDIEQDEDNLIQWHSKLFVKTRRDIVTDSKEEYYRLAGHFLYDFKFKTRLEKTIWKYHAEGMSIQKITDLLKDEGYKVYRSGIHKILQRLTNLMVNTCR